MKFDIPKSKGNKKVQQRIKKKTDPELTLPGNQRSNKLQKVQMKKAKKEHARRGILLIAS